MQFKEIKQTNSREFSDAMQIYNEAFPANERHSKALVSERVNNGLSNLYVASSNDEVTFLALLWPLKTTNFILLDYMATKATHRGKGIASSFLKEMDQKLRHTNHYLIMEVEDPKIGDRQDEKEKRVTFYKRHGAKILEGVRYLLPPLDGTDPTDMILMMFPERRDNEIDGALIKSVISQIYRELYDRQEGDALLRTFLHDIPHSVKLS